MRPKELIDRGTIRSSKVEFTLQVVIVLSCIAVILFVHFEPSVQAQTSCNGEPPLTNPTNPKSEAYPTGTSYAVSVFDPTSDSEFEQIRQGALDWNSHSGANCSGVSFQEATRATVPYEQAGQLPDNTIWVHRVSTGSQFTAEFRSLPPPQTWEIRAARVKITHPWTSNTPGYLKKVMSHELGHGFGLLNETFPAVSNRSVMGIAQQITSCDIESIRRVYCPPPTPSPTPLPTPVQCEPPYGGETQLCPVGTYFNPYTGMCCPDDTGGSGTCNTAWLEPQCGYQVNEYRACRDVGGIWENQFCRCWAESPIVIDIAGNGFGLTNAANGVSFDMRGDGTPDNLAWTSANSDDAFLVFDRNANGNIDNGRELFGNHTPQPPGVNRNGFLALAQYDKITQGGNEDGRITRHDVIFEYLRLWQDTNHNAISEPNELYTLPALGVARIDLDFSESRRTDQHGNRFRYRARVRDIYGAQVGRWAWDVFFITTDLENELSIAPKIAILLRSSEMPRHQGLN